MKEVIMELTWLDIIVLSIAIISVCINIVQLIMSKNEKKNKIVPISSSLTGLFNDIKTKENYVYLTQQLILHKDNPINDLDTLKWDYYKFLQSIINVMGGLKETVVSILVAINPDDKEGKSAFRAANYGLTDEDKTLRDEYTKRIIAQSQSQNKTS